MHAKVASLLLLTTLAACGGNRAPLDAPRAAHDDSDAGAAPRAALADDAGGPDASSAATSAVSASVDAIADGGASAATETKCRWASVDSKAFAPFRKAAHTLFDRDIGVQTPIRCCAIGADDALCEGRFGGESHDPAEPEGKRLVGLTKDTAETWLDATTAVGPHGNMAHPTPPFVTLKVTATTTRFALELASGRCPRPCVAKGKCGEFETLAAAACDAVGTYVKTSAGLRREGTPASVP